ncbi:nucleotide-binding protein [Jiella pacifica]|uniref:Plasmid partitioning-family protein n=1 Tax=Jiella pacifica TaxID=2696469 RepID=A0A6N9T942_9HYPH|nr:plasmid partitioning-family protein [Jiella pacifica]MAU43291.1 plasmid partitioning-family protein [Salipiger sp.]MAU43318.1 plasmid partitioning-family protein [Salipiger sp.]NDW07771.1 plasmid partitioning-family protein [Jiella pacifica]
MRTYSLISQKGGAGKSTIIRQLAVLASENGPSVIIDRDPQGTSTKWWQRRQEIDPPLKYPDLLISEGLDLTRAVNALHGKPGDLFIDTRPAVAEPEAEAARVSDVVIVPVRPSPDDLEAIGATLKIIRRLGKRAIVVVNAARNEARATSARAALSRYPVPVCPHHLTDRTIYLDAALEGRGVSEMRGGPAEMATAEIRRVWNWIRTEGTSHE